MIIVKWTLDKSIDEAHLVRELKKVAKYHRLSVKKIEAPTIDDVVAQACIQVGTFEVLIFSKQIFLMDALQSNYEDSVVFVKKMDSLLKESSAIVELEVDITAALKDNRLEKVAANLNIMKELLDKKESVSIDETEDDCQITKGLRYKENVGYYVNVNIVAKKLNREALPLWKRAISIMVKMIED